MPENARYSFLGWMRRGAVGLAGDASLTEKARVSLPLELEVSADGDPARTVTIPRQARIFGPGDVTGVSPAAIVRTTPRPGVRDFEANFLAAVEFYDEDFPWRYTPLLARDGRLQPWLWLVVLAEDEFTRAGVAEGRLPAIEIGEEALASAFPDPSATWAWAHVQLNTGLAAAAGDTAAARAEVRTLLDADPNLGSSRLVCPRRLAPSTHYSAFLVPAFEKGRLAGLGSPDREVDDVPNAAPAWPAADDVTGGRLFPVYYEWAFSTSSAGDFESLARLLTAVSSDLLSGDQLLDIQEPGWGVRYRSEGTDRLQPGAVALESALRVPDHESPVAFGTDPGDERLAKALRALISLGAEPPTGAAAEDPVLVPPLYGSFFRTDPRPADAGTWYEQLNLNPVYRVGAGQGTEVVREQQESLVNDAWDQLRQQMEARGVARRWQFSLHASARFFARRLEPALTLDPGAAVSDAERVRREALMFRAVSMTSPMHKALATDTGTFAAAIRGSRFAAAYTPAFTRATRTAGPLMRRLDIGRPAGVLEVFFDRRPRRPTPGPALEAALAAVLQILSVGGRRTPFELPVARAMNLRLQAAGLAGTGALRTALSALQARVQRPTHGFDLTPVAPAQLYAAIRAQVLPSRTIPARFRAVLGVATPATEAEADRIDLPEPAVEFLQPMYAELARRSAGHILPGLEGLPPNSVTMLEPNAAFIESYMLGLNHEIAREFLWRELPVRLDRTFFRQFWDVRDNPDAAADPERFKDLKPIAEWGATDLGAQAHRPPGMAGDLTVVVVRGDLLRKYPHTQVFLQRAAWASGPGGRQFRQADTAGADAVRMPLFSARIDPDLTLVGFRLDADDARGNPDPGANDPGWYVVFKERAGDVQLGLDLDPSAADPSWPALPGVEPHHCIDVESAEFRALPRHGPGPERIAAMLYQRPFAMHVHASRLLARG